MALKHPESREVLQDMGLAKQLVSFVVDESHCISAWGGEFRPAYGELGKLRTFVPHGTPIWAFSATMTPSVLQEVEAKLHINPYTSFHINLGNDRPNIAYKVVEVENSQDFASLLDVLQIGQVGSPEDIPKTLIFADTRNMVQRIWRYLREQLGETYHGVIDFLHAYRRQRGRQHAMKRFETGGIRILVATEAAGMTLRASCSSEPHLPYRCGFSVQEGRVAQKTQQQRRFQWSRSQHSKRRSTESPNVGRCLIE